MATSRRDIGRPFRTEPDRLLHVGNVRAALFNWLFARRHGGRFILRLDDTDRARSKSEFEAAIEWASPGSASHGT